MAKKGTELSSWRKDLAETAVAEAKTLEGLQGGQFFSVRGGQFTLGGAPVPGNTVVAVISAYVFEHAYYEGAFNPDKPASPVCFAFGRNSTEMAPHQAAVKPQAERCAVCPHNEFGSADRGKGKACKNVIRLALLQAGEANAAGAVRVDFSADSLAEAEAKYFRVPVTSVRAFAAYVNSLRDGAVVEYGQVPPWVLVTAIKPQPDPKTQFRMVFTAVGIVDDESYPVARKRHEELQETVGFPYQAGSSAAEDEEPAPAAKGKRARKY